MKVEENCHTESSFALLVKITGAVRAFYEQKQNNIMIRMMRIK